MTPKKDKDVDDPRWAHCAPSTELIPNQEIDRKWRS